MLYGSGIYIVSKDDMASFLEEVKQQYKDIDWFLPEEYIYRYFDKRDTHKLVFLGNEAHSKSYNKHKVTQISWQNPKPYNQALDSAKHMVKKGCRYSNNYWWVYRRFSEIESLYNILVSATELKNKFITSEPYEKVRIYIKPKEKDYKDAKDKLRNRFEEIKKVERAKLKELQKVTSQEFYKAVYGEDIPTEIKEEYFEEKFGDSVKTFEDLFT